MMEPTGWVVDTVGSGRKVSAGNGAVADRESPAFPEGFGPTLTRSPTDDDYRCPNSKRASATRSSAAADPGATPGGEAVQANQRGSRSSSLVDGLLRRIAREASDRRAEASRGGSDRSNTSWRHDRPSDRDWRRRANGDRDASISRDTDTRSSARSSREPSGGSRPERRRDANREDWGVSESEQHRVRRAHQSDTAVVDKPPPLAMVASTQRYMSGGLEGGGSAATVTDAEASPFTEAMWENVSCRQVLQAMFFAPGSAVPAGPTEEYNELEGGGDPNVRTCGSIDLLCSILVHLGDGCARLNARLDIVHCELLAARAGWRTLLIGPAGRRTTCVHHTRRG